MSETNASTPTAASSGSNDPSLLLHLGVLALLGALHFVLADYHHGVFARVLTFATFALGYNIMFGYTGMLSLGHAMFLAAGMYGAGLTITHLGWSAGAALPFGVIAAALLGLLVGLLALRTSGVALMIVTLMFAQAGYLTTIYFNVWTGGEDGLTLSRDARSLFGLDFADPDTRYLFALSLFSIGLMIKFWLVRSPTGRVLVAIRENEERVRMLGYDPLRYRLLALVVSAAYAGAAGASYALLDGYVGSSFAAIQYSILPLLWVLVGGAGTVLGPLLGALAMQYLMDYAKDVTEAYMIVVGAALVLLVIIAPKGLLGVVRERLAPWLP